VGTPRRKKGHVLVTSAAQDAEDRQHLKRVPCHVCRPATSLLPVFHLPQ